MWKRVAIIALALSALGYQAVVAALAAFTAPATSLTNPDPTAAGPVAGGQAPDVLSEADEQVLRGVYIALAGGDALVDVQELAEGGADIKAFIDQWNKTRQSIALAANLITAKQWGLNWGETLDALIADVPLEPVEEDSRNVRRENEAALDAEASTTTHLASLKVLRVNSDIEASLKERQLQIQAAIDDLRDLLAAIEFAQQGNFAAAAAELDGLPSAARLKRKWEFKDRAASFMTMCENALTSNDLASLQAVQQERRSLAAQYTQLGDADAADLWAQCDAWGNRADARVRLLNLPKPEALNIWLSEVESLLAADPDGRSLVRAKLLESIRARLPEAQTAFNETDQYAIETVELTVHKGIFVFVDSPNEGRDYYRYWPSMKAKSDGVVGTPLGAEGSNAISPPEIGPFVDAVNAYNEALNGVIEVPWSKLSWEELQRVCTAAQQKFSKFRTTYGVTSDVNFKNHLTFISDVLNNWQQVQDILSDR
jgi:hypothetical protein